MKKTILASLLSSSLILVACGDKGGESDSGDSTPTTADPSATDDSASTTMGGTDSDGSNTDPSDGTGTSDSNSDTQNPTTDDPTTGGDTDSDTCMFVCDVDMGADFECDNWAQDCPRGEKCAAWANDGGNSWNATKCVPETGSDQPGDQCMSEGGVSGEDSCAKGAMCWNVNEEGVGVCVGLCMGTQEMPDCSHLPMTNCVIANMGVLNLCLPGCHPLLQDCENDADVCIATEDGFNCVLDASGGEHPVNTPCEYANQCNKGLQCWDTAANPHPDCMGSIGCCAEYCDVTDPNVMCEANPPGLECVAWYEMGMAPPGLEDVGICIVPQ